MHIKQHVLDEVEPLLNSHDPVTRAHATDRRQAVIDWSTEEYPFAYGKSNHTRVLLVTAITTPLPGVAATHTLPKAHESETSASSLAKTFFRLGDIHGKQPTEKNKSRAPLFRNGITRHILPAVVYSLLEYITNRKTVSVKDAGPYIVEGFRDALVGLNIVAVPGAPATVHVGHNHVWASPVLFTTVNTLCDTPTARAPL
ncbi:hypothetical protein EIP91_007786, partial [Steccherinum ochraceum]